MRHALVFVAIVCTAYACAAQRDPIYAAADLGARDIREISVAPLVEERAFPETQIPLAHDVQQTADQALRRKGYEPRFVVDPPIARLDELLLDATASSLPPLPGRYALWLAAELMETDATEIGLDTRVRIAGILIDQAANEVLWRDRAERESSISGAGFATVSPSVRTYEAVSLAVASLLETLSDRSHP